MKNKLTARIIGLLASLLGTNLAIASMLIPNKTPFVIAIIFAIIGFAVGIIGFVYNIILLCEYFIDKNN